MTKKFAILLFCGFLSLSIKAQNFGGGLILGFSTSQVGGDDLGGFNKAGVLVGAFVNKSISPLLSFQMEMTYIQKGSGNPNITDGEHPDISKPYILLSYIEVPLLLQYQQSETLKIEGGLLSAYLIDGYYKDESGKMPIVNVNPFIKYDIGLMIGLDYKFSEKLSLNTRISNSILPIGEEDYHEIDSYDSSRKGKYNSILSFAIHYNL